MTTEALPARRQLRERNAPVQTRRLDIQGLRTLAALLVAAYHIWTYRISGAVDVFFVVSAFVMTQSLLRGIERGGSVRLGRFYRDLLFRMAPLAWIVAGGALIAGLVFLPVTDWTTMARQATSAATFSINYFLGFESMAYLGDEANSSLFQHFWAMAVQVQFYLLFPLIAVLAVAVGRRIRRSAHGVFATLLALVFVTSFAYAIVGVIDNQAFAYFDTGARAWEFAAGALAAIALPALRWGRAISIAAAALGVLILVSFGAVVDATLLSPGIATLLPVGAALLILIGGANGQGAGATRLLSSKPLVAAADYSFGFYLWHWPVLTIYRELFGVHRLDLIAGLGVIAASGALAFITQRWLERPVRSAARRASVEGGWRRPFVGLAALALLPALAIGGTRGYVDWLLAATPTTNPGAAAIADDGVELSPFAEVQPALATLAEGQWESWGQSCADRTAPGGAGYRECSAGERLAPLQVVAVGDSHTEIWLTAFGPAIESGAMRLTSLFSGACPLSTVGDDKWPSGDPAAEACAALNAERGDIVLGMEPDVVVTTASIAQAGDPALVVPDGFVDAARQITEAGVPIVGLRDAPRHGASPSACLEESGMDAVTCAVPQDELLADLDFETAVPDPLVADPLFTTVDMTDLLCFGGWCPAVIGGVIPYLDDNHLTRDYVATMSPYLLERFSAALDRIPTPVALPL